MRMNQTRNNRLTFLVSLVLAMIAWVYVMNNENPMMTREIRLIPVILRNQEELINQDLVIMEPQDPMISVTLQGLRNTLYQITPNEIIAEVDLRGYGEGVHRASINIRQPAETSVYAVSNRDLLINIEKQVERTLVVEAQIEEDTMEQDFLYKKVVEPESITFKAPRSIANRVAQARVVIDVSDQTASYTTTKRIELVDVDGQAVQGIELADDTATVSLEVNRVKVVPIVIAHTGTLPEGVTVVTERIEPNTIRIQGPDELVQNLESIRTEPIDYADMATSGQRNVGLRFPDGIREDEAVEPVYSFTVRTPVEQSFLIGRSAITLENPPDGLNSRLGEGNPIMIRLTGEEEDIAALEESRVKLYVDLEGLGEGTHEIQVQMEPIEGLRFDPDSLPEIPVYITDPDEIS